jgi:hypothetical protein
MKYTAAFGIYYIKPYLSLARTDVDVRECCDITGESEKCLLFVLRVPSGDAPRLYSRLHHTGAQ